MLDCPNSVEEYCEYAKSIGISGFAITEHGNLANWSHKKKVMEENGFKYIHAVEAYISNSLKTPSYHCVLIAKNYDGVEELNVLTSNSFEKGNGFICDEKHFYYVPRIFVDEIVNSENIIVLTACLGGFPNRMFRGDEDAMEVAEKLLPWGVDTGKLYLEIQPQNNSEQIEYNKKMVELSKDFGLPLIATNDVHYVRELHKLDRDIIQLSADIVFDNGDESSYELHMKSEQEIRDTFIDISEEAINEAIENTVKLAESIEEFELDYSPKYPKIYDDEEGEFLKRIEALLSEKRISDEEFGRLVDESQIYKKLGQMSYIMMCSDWLKWLRDNDIHTGDGRGSCTGSQIAYRFGATGVNSMKWETNLFRFLNPDRVSMADIDIDIPSFQRNKAKSWFYDHPRMVACEVGAFGTYQEKKAIASVAKAFNKAVQLGKLEGIAFEIDKFQVEEIKNKTMKFRKMDEYAQFFAVVDRLQDKISDFKNHPAGVVVWHNDLKRKIGYYATSNEDLNGKPISNFNMNELDALNYIKMDALGLSTMETVNVACDIAGIDRLNSDNVDYEDKEVWDNIINNGGAGIFQFSGANTYNALNKALISYGESEISNFFVMCHCSGIIRPSCASIRDDFLEGLPPRWCFEEITNFFPKTFGYIVYQEDIMNFLTKFCGYSGSESDSVRRKIAKKKKAGYTEMLEEISRRFRTTMTKLAEEKWETYDDEINNVDEMIESDLEYFIQVVEDAQNYAFSYNHSMPYTSLGYISAYLRTHHPVAFFTALLNAYIGDEDKMHEAFAYIKKYTNIEMKTAVWGGQIGSTFTADIGGNAIYEGLSDIKNANKDIAEKLKSINFNGKYFMDFLLEAVDAGIGKSNLLILNKIDFFSSFYGQVKVRNLIEEFFSGKSKFDKKHSEKTTEKRIPIRREIEDAMEDEDEKKINKFTNQLYHIGKSNVEFANVKEETYVVIDVSRSFSNYWVELYDLNTKQHKSVRYSKKNFDNIQEVAVGEFIRITDSGEQFKKTMEDGKWVTTNVKFIQMYEFKKVIFK